MEIDVGVVFVDDFFAVYYYIFGFIKNAGQYFALFIIRRNEILKMQDVTDRRVLAGILTQAEGNLRNSGEILLFYLCMFQIIAYVRMYDDVLYIYIYICISTVYVCNVPIAIDTPGSYENPVSWLITVVLVEIRPMQ